MDEFQKEAEKNVEEMKESASLVEQALRRLKPGPIIADNRKVALPPRLTVLFCG